MASFCAITVRSDWGYFDYVAMVGRDLKDGEEVEVRWPDGIETRERVRLDRTMAQSARPGDEIPTVRAYVDAKYRGVATRVYLRQPGVAVRPIG